MPRTLNATLEAALDSGNFTFYSLLTVKEVGFGIERTAQPVSFKLSGIEMDVKYSALDHDVYDGYSYPEELSFMLTRGVTIAGINYTIDSSYYFGVSSEWDGVFETIHASMLPNTKYSAAGDGTYKAVLDAICVANGKTAIYKNPTAAWLSYQFLPTGKTLDMNKASNLLNLIKQKYLIYACDNGSDQILFCSVASDSTALDHTLNIEKLKLNANLRNYRRFLSRDEAATIHYSGNAAAPLWNLGFLHSTAAHPAFSNSGGIEILPIAPHLKYLSFDNFQFNFAANYPDITYTSTGIALAWVEEVFDPKAKIAWHIKVSSFDWGKGAEGGALPGTIERVAAYTPLVSTGFDGNLTPAVNNLQAFAQAVDDLDVPVLAGVAGAIATHAAVQTGVHGLAITAGKTLTVTESLTLAAGAAGLTATVPESMIVAGRDVTNTFTANQTVVREGTFSLLGQTTYSDILWHGNFFLSQRFRGSLATPAATQNADSLFTFDVWGADSGAISRRAADIKAFVNGTPTSGVVVGKWQMRVANVSGVMSDILSLLHTAAGFFTATPTISDGVGVHINGKILRIGVSKTPASASATGNVGEICWDANYIYVCVVANTWKRVGIATW